MKNCQQKKKGGRGKDLGKHSYKVLLEARISTSFWTHNESELSLYPPGHELTNSKQNGLPKNNPLHLGKRDIQRSPPRTRFRTFPPVNVKTVLRTEPPISCTHTETCLVCVQERGGAQTSHSWRMAVTGKRKQKKEKNERKRKDDKNEMGTSLGVGCWSP